MIMMAVICIAGSALNIVITKLCFYAEIPLYLDTILTVSITMTCGLFWGVLCGFLTNFINHFFWGWGWEGYLFIICNAATAFVTWLIIRLFPQELNLRADKITAESAKSQVLKTIQTISAANKSNRFGIIMDRVIVLIILSFALCLAMSFLGGLIAAIILSLSSSYNFAASGIDSIFSATMFNENTPILISEIASRIPVNIIDRSISAFGGFGIALCIRRLTKRRQLPA